MRLDARVNIVAPPQEQNPDDKSNSASSAGSAEG